MCLLKTLRYLELAESNVRHWTRLTERGDRRKQEGDKDCEISPHGALASSAFYPYCCQQPQAITLAIHQSAHAVVWVGDFANRISNTSSPAPTTIALSAKLKTGHW